MNTKTSTDLNPLTDMASDIRRLHQEALKHADTALQLALQAGQLLIKAKAEVKHGEWITFVESAGMSRRTASRYMKLANNREALESKWATGAHLTVKEAEKLLAAPRAESKYAFTPEEWREMDHDKRYEYGLKDLSVEMRRQVVSWEPDDHWEVKNIQYHNRIGACMMLTADDYDIEEITAYLKITALDVQTAMACAPLPHLYEWISKELGEETDIAEYTRQRVDRVINWNRRHGLSTAWCMSRRDKRTHLYKRFERLYDDNLRTI